jgi:hypothetical protein
VKRIPLFIGRRHNPQVIRIVAEMTADGATEREIREHLEGRLTDPIGTRAVTNIRRRHHMKPARTADEVAVVRLTSAQPVTVRRLHGRTLSPELVEAIRVLVGRGLSSREIHARLHPHVTLIGLQRWMARHRNEIRGAA